MSGRTNNFSTWQQMAILLSNMIGVGVLYLPRTASEFMHESGWLGPLFGFSLVLLPFMAVIYLSKRHPGLTFVEISQTLLTGKRSSRLGRALSFPWVLLFLGFQYVNAGNTARSFGEVVVTAVLLETPLEVIIITLFLTVLFLCMHEVDVVARVNELLLPVLVIPVFLIPLVSFMNAEWNNLLPVHIDSWQVAFKTGINTFMPYTGYELMLIYFAFSMPGTRIGWASWTSLGLTVVAYILTVMAGIAVFGYEELQKMIWPTLELVKVTQRSGLFLERLESAFLAIWVASVFTTTGNMYYATIYGIRLWFRKGIWFQRICAFLLMIPLFFIALVPQNIVELFDYGIKLSYFAFVTTIIIPILFAFISMARRQTKKTQQESKKEGT